MPALFTEALSETADSVRAYTVEVEGRGHGSGSGVLWNSDGLVVTNAHVVRRAGAQITLPDGRRLKATLARRDPHFDLALLDTGVHGLPAASIANSGSLRVGELVLAVGSPYGQPGTVTVGIVHSGETRRWIQSDLRLAPGNSGGPLADAQGRLIGINTMVVNRLALSIPSNIVSRFVARRDEAPRRLGVTVQPVTVPHFGLLILEVDPNGPAHRAALRIGDVITGVGGRALEAPFDLALALESADERLTLDVLRGGRPITSQIEFTPQPVRAEVA